MVWIVKDGLAELVDWPVGQIQAYMDRGNPVWATLSGPVLEGHVQATAFRAPISLTPLYDGREALERGSVAGMEPVGYKAEVHVECFDRELLIPAIPAEQIRERFMEEPSMNKEQFIDGFLRFSADDPTRLSYAPFVEPEDFDDVSPRIWASAWHMVDSYETAQIESELDAKTLFTAAKKGDISDNYEKLEDVPRDRIMRARIFANGIIHAFALAGDPEDGTIKPGETPDLVRHPVEICTDFGLEPPFGSTEWEPSLRSECIVTLRIDDIETFEDHFGVHPSELSERKLRDQLVFPADSRPSGAKLIEIESSVEADRLHLKIAVEITDPLLFQARASVAGRQSGRDKDWYPETASEAIYDFYVASNDSPIPLDCGYELLDWKAPGDEGPSGPAY